MQLLQSSVLAPTWLCSWRGTRACVGGGASALLYAAAARLIVCGSHYVEAAIISSRTWHLHTQHTPECTPAVHCRCAGTKLPADMLAQLLQHPTSEMRVAAYRLTMALGFRPWCAAHLLSTPAAVDRLLDASSETGKANCEWRHSCVLALSAAVQAAQELPAGHPEAAHAAVLLGAFGRVSAAVRGGPFGGGPALTQADHIVATEAR